MKIVSSTAKIFSLVFLLTACSPNSPESPTAEDLPVKATEPSESSLSMNKAWLGQWTAVSNNYMAITGDMAIGSVAISWEKFSNNAYEILFSGDNYVLVKLENSAVCGIYLKLGPTREANDYTDIEVTFYAQLPQEFYTVEGKDFKPGSEWMADIESSCSSGMFSR